ncbi:MAG: PQQ-dependent sugar dehydrogenase [Akkermansiaceae bacterium]|nr:PQQ-dependent sugar dehydrogenase [Akkermansiaceae bacterium]
MRKFLLALAVMLSCSAICGAAPGLDAPQPVGAYLNGVFPQTTPGPTGTWGTADAFPNLTFIDPVRMIKDPLSAAHVYIVCRNGEIWRIPFSSTATTAQKVRFLDRKANTWGYWDTGMLSMAFHPEYGVPGSPNRGYVYVFYQYIPVPIANNVGSSSYMRVSRFTVPDGATVADPASEYVLIQQYDRHNWHGGGGMFFAPDGFLHIVIGDEGDANDSHGAAQKLNSRLFSGILRIDVDRDPEKSHPIRRQPAQLSMPSGWPQSFTQGYYIPDDNPWQDPAGGILEEFWTVGTRSPHSMHFDRASGDIWIADVGQGTREEITIARKGGNHQWPYKEGLANGPKAKPANLIGEDNPPVYDYGRSMGGCIIGGIVYRGSLHSGSLTGKYIFGDHNTKAIYALNRPQGAAASAEYLTEVKRSGGTKAGLSGICEGPDGEVYFMELGNTGADTGKIYKLVRTGGAVADPPQLLSQTGAFSNLATLTPAQGLIPYDVNSPLWTDGAEKKRWIAIPNNGTHNTAAEQVTYSETGAWKFPVGTVLVKHFALPVDERNPSIVKPVETRFFVHGSNGTYYGVTYRWNEAGTDAQLMTTGGSRDMTVTKADGTTRTQRWDFPSRSDCRTCHTTSSDNVLGVRSHQLAGDHYYSLTGRTSDQLETWNSLGIFGTSFGSRNPATLPRAVNPHDPHASLDQRVKSYLDANCSHCHHPSGVSANFDATFSTALFAQGIVGGLINRPINGQTDKVVDPGNIARSLLHGRFSVTGTNQMPPLGKNVVDTKAVALVEDWIRSLDSAGFPDATFGIRGDYYTGRNFNTLAFSRVDTAVNFNWENGPPGAGVSEDDFSVRWQGKLIPPSTGTYTLHATGDDGIRVKINGSTIINAWIDQPPTEHSGTVTLTADQAVDLVVEYYEATGGSVASLAWTGPGISKQAIPPSAYRLSQPFNAAPVARNDAFTVTHGAPSTLDVLANDEDGDAPLGIHGVAIKTPPSHGTVRIDGAGKRLVYTHNGLSSRSDSFTYTVTDPEGVASNTATVTLSIPFDFAAWAASTPGAGGSAASNGDGDLYPDLLEFALGGSPQSGAFAAGEPLALVEQSGAVSFTVRRPVGLSGVRHEVFTSPDLVTWTLAGTPVISPDGSGYEKLAFQGLEGRPGLTADRGFARLKVTLEPSGGSAVSLPLGWLAAEFGAGTRTLGNPFRTAVFSSKVTSVTGNKLRVMGDPPATSGYVEITTGTHEGRRFDVTGISGNEIELAGTLPDLAGANLVLCQHDTLGGTFPKDLFRGSTNPGEADQVQFHVNDGTSQPKFELFYLLDARPGNATHQWRAFIPGGGDRGGRIISAGEGVFVKRQAGVPTARIVLRGQVRANAFRQTLRQGVNLTASPFPLPMTPRQRGMCDPLAGFTASTNVGNADQFQIMRNGAFRIFYLLDHPTLADPWRETVPGSPDYSDNPIFAPTEAAFMKRNQASHLHLIPLPWNP